MKSLIGALGALVMAAMLIPVSAARETLDIEPVDCSVPGSGGRGNPPTDLNSVLLRASLLGGLRGGGAADDNWYWQMICEANNWKVQGAARGGDINNRVAIGATGPVDTDDALIMYHSYRLTTRMTAHDQDGVLLRASLLNGIRGPGGTSDDLGGTRNNDEHFLNLITRAFKLRCETSTATPVYTHDLCDDTENDEDLSTPGS